MNSSPAKRAIDNPQRTAYLRGWVAAIHSGNVSGDNVFYLEESERDCFGSAMFRVFKNQSSAENAIRSAYKQNSASGESRIAIRKLRYLTNDPKSARGLSRWSESDSDAWIFINS